MGGRAMKKIVTEAKTVTITFDCNGGSAVENKDVVFGETYGTLGTPTKAGYTFVGWYTRPAAGAMITKHRIGRNNDVYFAQW